MKHAYLILAHTGAEDLFHLLRSIDDVRNDIYLMLDKKWKKAPTQDVLRGQLRFSSLFLIERRNVQWGSDSLIKAELLLFECALRGGEYEYFHLLSGQDLCLKRQDEIHEYFAQHRGEEFLTFCGKDWNARAQRRVMYYYFAPRRKGILRALNGIGWRIQRVFHVDRRTAGVEYVGGSNWVSITRDLCALVVENRKKIEHAFAHTYCADELFLHTIVYNSSFRERVHYLYINEINNATPRMYEGNMRYIDWTRGGPYVFCETDFEDLMSCPWLFARKVSAKNNLPKMILAALQQK